MRSVVRYLKVVSAIFIGILFFSFTGCSNFISNNISDSERNEIDSIIAHNNLTITYLWTEWCGGSREHFIQDVVPYLLQKSDTIGFISIFYGTEEVLESILLETECDYPIFRIESLGGLDKNRMYKLLNSFLKDYKRMNYVPVSVICDKNGNILNYDEDKKEYSHIVDCIESVGSNVDSVDVSCEQLSQDSINFSK